MKKLSRIILSAFLFIILLSTVQAVIVFSTGAAAKIVVTKVLSATHPELLAAYQGAISITQFYSNPTAFFTNFATGQVDQQIPGFSKALAIVTAGSPVAAFQGMAMNEIQQQIIGQVYNQLPPDQKIAFLNAQEIVSSGVIKITKENQVSYDKNGLMIIKTEDGKNFMQIPKGCEIKAAGNELTLVSGDAEDQELKFKEDVSAYLKKGGTIKVQGDKIVEADFTTSKESKMKLGDNKELTVPADTKVSYKDGQIIAEGKDKELTYGKEKITILGNDTISIAKNTIEGKNFEIGDIKVQEICFERPIGMNNPSVTGKSIAILPKTGPFLSKTELFCEQGSLSFDDNGYLVHQGILEKNKVELKIAPDEDVLLANQNADMSSYKNNWIKISKDKIDAKSIEGSKIDFEVLPGNELFNTFTREYAKDNASILLKFKSGDDKEGFLKDEYGYKYKKVSDEKELLKFEIAEGDGLSAKSRNGKIPEISHLYNGGSVKIQDGRNGFVLNDELRLITLSISKDKEFEMINNGKYQSVPFELLSPSIKDSKLRIGATNQYAIIDKNDNERVVFNKYGIPVSVDIDQMKTLDQLRAKWGGEGIKFGIKGKSMFEEILGSEKMNYTSVSPNLVQITDYWLEKNKDKIKDLKSIEFSDFENAAYAGQNTIILGERIFDSDVLKKLEENYPDREFGNVMATLDHEYTHLQDDSTTNKEGKILQNIVSENKHDKSVPKAAMDKITNKIKNEEITVNHFLVSISATDVENIQKDLNKRETILSEKGYDYYKAYYGLSTNEEVDKDISGWKQYLDKDLKENEIKDYFDNLSKKYKNELDLQEASLKKQLDELQNKQLSDEAYKQYTNLSKQYMSILDKDSAHEEWDVALNETLAKYGDFVIPAVQNYRSRIEIENYWYDFVINQTESKPLDTIYKETVQANMDNLIKNKEYQDQIAKMVATLQTKIENIPWDKRQSGRDLIKEYNSSGAGAIVNYLTVFEAYSQYDKDIKNQNTELINLVHNETGLPANYALRKYSTGVDDYLANLFGGYQKSGSYNELSSTFMEEPLDTRKAEANSENPNIQNEYRKLTQLAFDSGKMNQQECNEIMGEKCEECVIYKLTCCVTNPKSPNCKK